LYSIGIITLPEIIQSVKTIDVEIMNTDVKISISKQEFGVHNTEKKIFCNKYEPKIGLKDKVHLETYHIRQPGNVVVNETPTKIKAQEL